MSKDATKVSETQPMFDYNKQRLREAALSLAHQNHDSREMTISRAEAYYAFLTKND